MSMTNEQLRQLLIEGTPEQIQDAIDNIHPADILDIINNSEEDLNIILPKLPNDVIASIIEEEEDEDKYDLLEPFLKERQKAILEEMSDDEIADLIGELEDEKQIKEVLDNLDSENQDNVKQLLSYEPDTAGGLMSTEFISIHSNNTVLETLWYLQKYAEQDAKYYLYVVDKSKVLKGVIALRDIVTSSFGTKIIDITNPNVKTLFYKDDQEEVANRFIKYGFVMMPVVDEENHLIGVVEVDDVMDVMEDETTEDINLLAGVSGEERVDSTVFESFKSRTPWLIVNLFTAVMAAAVVNQFSATIAKVVSLSAIMSIVTGMPVHSHLLFWLEDCHWEKLIIVMPLKSSVKKLW